jgi:hypothetical protein
MPAMIRIAISAEAFDAIAATPQLGDNRRTAVNPLFTPACDLYYPSRTSEG